MILEGRNLFPLHSPTSLDSYNRRLTTEDKWHPSSAIQEEARSKILSEQVYTLDEEKSLKTIVDNDIVWISFIVNHNVNLSEEQVIGFYNHTIPFSVWTSMNKQGNRMDYVGVLFSVPCVERLLVPPRCDVLPQSAMCGTEQNVPMNPTYILDGIHLLHKIVWSHPETYREFDSSTTIISCCMSSFEYSIRRGKGFKKKSYRLGLELEGHRLLPIPTLAYPVSPNLLKFLACNCKKNGNKKTASVEEMDLPADQFAANGQTMVAAIALILLRVMMRLMMELPCHTPTLKMITLQLYLSHHHSVSDNARSSLVMINNHLCMAKFDSPKSFYMKRRNCQPPNGASFCELDETNNINDPMSRENNLHPPFRSNSHGVKMTSRLSVLPIEEQAESILGAIEEFKKKRWGKFYTHSGIARILPTYTITLEEIKVTWWFRAKVSDFCTEGPGFNPRSRCKRKILVQNIFSLNARRTLAARTQKNGISLTPNSGIIISMLTKKFVLILMQLY
ncbi:unnamed protein product [Timema podura]|uniref:DUF4550 domain-containing protein n=1 Tax=Timema podura TaxID=61482 RepID=A0ABN7NZE8_TIMPD|nr:unnamed protein product [Timema podura]